MSDARRDALWIVLALLLIELLLLVAVALYAIGATSTWRVLAAGAILTVGTFAVGALFGLLFGFPHSVQKPTATEEGKWAVQPNKSFDDITDWLTKILVGVGLTQLAGLPSKLQSLGSFLAPMLGGGETSAGLAVTVVICSTVIGFMSSFVFTKLILSEDLVELGAVLAKAEAPRSQEVKAAVRRQNDKLPPAKQIPAAKHDEVFTLSEDLIRQVLSGNQHRANQLGIDLKAVGSRGRLNAADLDKVASFAIDNLEGSAELGAGVDGH